MTALIQKTNACCLVGSHVCIGLQESSAESGFTMVLADLQLSELQQHDCFVMKAGSLHGIGLHNFIS